MENPEKEKSGKIRKWAKMDRQGKWVSLLLFSTPQRPETRVLILIGILPSLTERAGWGGGRKLQKPCRTGSSDQGLLGFELVKGIGTQ